MKTLRLFTCLSLMLSTAFLQVNAQTLTFTNCGSTGRFGPTQGMADTEYGPSVVTVTGGVQAWTVPATANYHIKACGAQGGSNSAHSGGAGACVEGDFFLVAGQTVEILVGQTGEDLTLNYNTGGGGGSFVWISGSTTEPLLAAGGGGGSGLSAAGLDASITTSGTNGTGTIGTPGTGGFGASQGGAGWKSDGGNYTGSSTCTIKCTGGGNGVSHGGASPLTTIGFHGCAGTNLTGDGGFGGGGGGNGNCSSSYGAGGGGGYSGGVGNSGASTGGGGGGSYNAGLNQTNVASIQSGDGVVEITQLIPPSPHDAGITEFPSLNGGVVCAGTVPVTAKIQNFGIQELDSVFVEWEVNGVAPSPGTWVQLNGLDTVYGPDDDTTITLGNFNFVNGTSYVVKAWTSLPNNLNDTININDTNAVLFVPALSGTYFITPSGVGGAYTSFNAAVSDLTTYGVCGPVTFIVDHATYNERVVIPEIPTMSDVNTVRFTALNGQTSAVDLTFASTGTADNGTLVLEGGDHFIFDHLTITNTSTGTYSSVVTLQNSSCHNTFDSLNLVGNQATTTTSNFAAVIRDANASIDSNLVITNNNINGGSYSIYMYGTNSSTFEPNNVVSGNMMTDWYIYGLYGYYTEDLVVSHNVALPHPTSSFAYNRGYYFFYANGSLRFHDNRFASTKYGYGAYFGTCSAPASKPGYIYNNSLSVGDAGVTSTSYALYMTGSNNQVVHSNSVYMNSNGTNSRALYITGGSNNRYFSNNFVVDGPGYGMYVLSGISESDYNNVYAPNGNFGYASGIQPTLSDFQAATATDMHSVSANPSFPAYDDLTTCNDTLDMAGIADTMVVTDLNGNLRSSIPDIGAHEFDGIANFSMGSDTLICSHDSITLGNAASTSSWIWNTIGPGPNTITVNNPNTYVAQISSVCGIAYDTVTVGHRPDAIADFDVNSSYLTGIFTDVSSGADTWTWDFGDGNGSTSQNPLHVYASGGTYLVTLTITGICGTSTFSDSITVGVVGVDEFNAINFTVYPNPTNGMVSITSSELNSGAMIEILDATGRMVSQSVMSGNQSDLNVSSLESGMYFVRVRHEGKTSTKQLIIQ